MSHTVKTGKRVRIRPGRSGRLEATGRYLNRALQRLGTTPVERDVAIIIQWAAKVALEAYYLNADEWLSLFSPRLPVLDSDFELEEVQGRRHLYSVYLEAIGVLQAVRFVPLMMKSLAPQAKGMVAKHYLLFEIGNDGRVGVSDEGRRVLSWADELEQLEGVDRGG